MPLRILDASSQRMKALQSLDKGLGRVACLALQPMRLTRVLQRATPVERVLLIKFWGLGSLQLLTPAVRALRQRYSGAKLSLLTLRQNEEFARGLGCFDEILTLEVGGGSLPTVFRRILALVPKLRRGRYQTVYDFEFFTRFSSVITLLTGARERHGFAAPDVWRGGFHTHTTPFNRYWHVARNFRCLAGGEDGMPVDPEDLIAYRTSDADRAALDAALTAVGLDGPGPLVALNPNAGSLSLERRWPQSHFAALARHLVLEDGARVVLIGSGSEAEYTGGVAARLNGMPAGSVANLAGKLSLGSVQSLFQQVSVFVSNDSGPMHLAAAQGAPTVGLFGPETPVMYAPLGPRARVVYEPPPCSPCINVHDNKVANCVRGLPECLINLTVDRVLDEARALMLRRELHTFDLSTFELPRSEQQHEVS